MEDRWLSVDEIAQYLGVSRDTIYNWIATRGLPAHRVGRLWKFKREAVDAWVESGRANDRDARKPDRDGVASTRRSGSPTTGSKKR